MQDSLDKAGRDIKIYNTTQPETGYGIQVIQGEHKFAVPEDYNWTSWIFGSYRHGCPHRCNAERTPYRSSL